MQVFVQLAVVLATTSLIQGVDSSTCMSSGCHDGQLSFQVMHSPVTSGDCEFCHEAGESEHEFKMIENVTELCTTCHSDTVERKNIHFAAEQDCTFCHDPHGSDFSSLLTAQSEKDLCVNCHDGEMLTGKFQHGPAAAGVCSTCHDPHSSNEERLLKASITESCTGCHDILGEEMSQAVSLHEPVKNGCTACHNPHSSPFPFMLATKEAELCASCHDVAEQASESRVDHQPAVDGDCASCHTPHGSQQASLLKSEEAELCLSCHGSNLAAGSDLTDMQALLDQNKEWHGPVREGSCSGCHQPHGSDRHRLLTEAFPDRFYSPFERGRYQLCFSCHDEGTIEAQYTLTATDFRDGDLNLHYLHVNKERRGRSCKACHEVHASPLPVHLRESVPFGNWDLPINFKGTEAGGTCTPGCHAEAGYDRTKKIDLTSASLKGGETQ